VEFFLNSSLMSGMVLGEVGILFVGTMYIMKLDFKLRSSLLSNVVSF